MVSSKIALSVLPAIIALTTGTPVTTAEATHPRAVHLDTFGSFQDGTYQMQYDADGIASVTVINSTIPAAPVTPIAARSADLLTKRACGTGVGCDGIGLNSGDCDRAVVGLKNQCGAGKFLPYIGSIYTIVGDTVAFYCQWDTQDSHIHCTADSDGNANALITDCCGLYGAGSFSDQPNKLVPLARTYSYGYTTVEHGWCVCRGAEC